MLRLWLDLNFLENLLPAKFPAEEEAEFAAPQSASFRRLMDSPSFLRVLSLFLTRIRLYLRDFPLLSIAFIPFFRVLSRLTTPLTPRPQRLPFVSTLPISEYYFQMGSAIKKSIIVDEEEAMVSTRDRFGLLQDKKDSVEAYLSYNVERLKMAARDHQWWSNRLLHRAFMVKRRLVEVPFHR